MKFDAREVFKRLTIFSLFSGEIVENIHSSPVEKTIFLKVKALILSEINDIILTRDGLLRTSRSKCIIFNKKQPISHPFSLLSEI